ncbi:MAG: hypothetical protein ACFE8M_10520 [Candidatus Hermodarchaeota archaeon]
MSSAVAEKDKEIKVKIDIRSDQELGYILSKMIIPFTRFLEPDIYNGNELMSFSQRHSTFKALMLTEFEDAIKEFSKVIKRNK